MLHTQVIKNRENGQNKPALRYTGIMQLIGKMGLLVLSGVGLAHADNQYWTIPIIEKNIQGVQQVELNLATIAAYQMQPKQLYVVDANQQIMPLRVAQPQQKARLTQIPLVIYPWPSQAILDDPARLNQLQLQLQQSTQQSTRQGTQHTIEQTTLIWPESSLQVRGRSQRWLLASPKLSSAVQPNALILHWRAKDFSSVVRVEGSDNLQDWQFAGLGQILQTRDASGQPLLQQRVEINQAYRYWRLSVDQALDLQQVSLQAQQPDLPLWSSQRLSFKPLTPQANGAPHEQERWQLQLPYPIAIQALQFAVPAQQLWQVNLQAKLPQQGRESWQTLAQTELYDWQSLQKAPAKPADSNPNAGMNNPLNSNAESNNRIELAQPVVARAWQLSLSAPQPQSSLEVQVFAPKMIMYFLAQGRAPYQVIINPNILHQSPRLPEQLVVSGQSHLGTISLQTTATSKRQYGLWVGLMLLVGVLAVAAWHLYRSLQQAKSTD